ncbi:MAG: FecR domain-containing protein [Rubripirellula sp.]
MSASENHKDNLRRQVADAIEDARDGKLTGARQDEIRELLLTDPQARDAYLEHSQMTWMLCIAENLDGKNAEQAASHQKALAAALAAALTRGTEAKAKTPKRYWGFVSIAATVAAVAAMIAFAIVNTGTTDSSIAFASIVESHQAKWSGVPTPRLESSLSDQRYTLASGAVRLKYRNGAELLVQAPSTFSIDNESQATLVTGSLSLYAPSTASGFRIETPFGTVVDRGTRIGVFANQELGMEVHVFEGKAEAIRKGERKGKMLDAGEAVSLATLDADFVSMNAMPSHFALSMDRISSLPIVSGDIALRVSPPRSVRRVRSELVDLGRATIFPERESVELLEDLPVTCNQPGQPVTFESNDFTVPARLRVDTYLVHFAVPKSVRRTGESVVATGSLSFNRPVLGIVCAGPGRIPATLVSSGTEYPTDKFSGLEDSIAGHPDFADSLQLSDDRKTITFHLHVHGRDAAEQDDFVDQFRIFVKSAR